jgi:alkylation response protein AidB-like acyl-CoA dehydrogenase
VIADVELTPEQDALSRSLTRFCQERRGASFDAGWKQLGDLGVLTLATADAGGGAGEVAVAMAVLGAAGFPGPLAATLLAAHADPSVTMGTFVVGPLVPWGAQSDLVLEWDGDGLWRVATADDGEACVTIGGEPALRASVVRIEKLSHGTSQVLALAHLAVAAYLTGAAGALIEGAAAYVADRRQFGRPVGEFQAVAFPLADAAVRVRAAGHLAWSAAGAIDGDSPSEGFDAAATARLSARRAALTAVQTCHQAYGALSYTTESPMAILRQRVADHVLLPPPPAGPRPGLWAAPVR